MKRTLFILGLVSSGLAHAQQGNVGVNTEKPTATFEVRTTNANLAKTTNEGIIAPKLTKQRIANTATPVEGTIVYATDANYTGSNAKVAKITEKGYYYYNGGEWLPMTTKPTKTPIRTSTNVETTLTIEDNGGYVYINYNSGPIAGVNVPKELPVGFSCVIVQKGTSQVVVEGRGGAIVQTARGIFTRERYSAIGIIKDSETTFTITGDASNVRQ